MDTTNCKFDQLIQLLTLKKMEKVWMHNLAENLPTIRKAHDICDIPKQTDKPCLVVGAGPSIKHINLKLLRRWNGIIICADRMIKPLLQLRVKPFISLTVDGSEKICDFFNDPLVQKYLSKIKTVLNCQTTHPEVSKLIPLDSQHYFVGMWDDPFSDGISITRIFQELTDKKIMQTAGNAGAAAWFLALFLGCNPIALLGIDFAYDTLNPEETLYNETFKILSGNNPQKYWENYKQTTTWAGKQVLTDIMFLTYYKSLVPQLLEVKEKTKTYNLGEYSIIPAEAAEPMRLKIFLKNFG